MENIVPEFFTLEEDLAVYCPHGEFTFEQTVDMIDKALADCRENQIRRVLIDIRDVTGFPSPTTTQRFEFATKWAETAGPYVKMSMMCRPELIDPEKIGVTMARNRGLTCDVFTDEPEARTWLLASEAS